MRELKNVIERAVILSQGGALRLELSLPDSAARRPAASPDAATQSSPGEVLTEDAVRTLERDNLVRALEATGWKVSGPGGAAELLGLRPSTLADRMRRWRIERPRQREEPDAAREGHKGNAA